MVCVLVTDEIGVGGRRDGFRVSHILKLLRENQTKEEERRQKKVAEKAAEPKPAISNEMEARRAKIEELQLRREATLAEDKAKSK